MITLVICQRLLSSSLISQEVVLLARMYEILNKWRELRELVPDYQHIEWRTLQNHHHQATHGISSLDHFDNQRKSTWCFLPQRVTPPTKMRDLMIFRGSNIHIARYYDGTKYNLAGGFIATSPSITQFHNDYSSFYTRNVNDTLEVYCTILSCASLTLDGVSIVGSAQQKDTIKVDDASYYIFTVPVAQPGFHRLDLDPSKNGVYGFFVTGKNGQYSYGYEGGANSKWNVKDCRNKSDFQSPHSFLRHQLPKDQPPLTLLQQQLQPDLLFQQLPSQLWLSR